jgi:hypothetical protein
MINLCPVGAEAGFRRLPAAALPPVQTAQKLKILNIFEKNRWKSIANNGK